MKTLKELKKEQYDLKAKLHEVVEFINSEEYFNLSPREKGLICQQRGGMEMYLNALTNRIYSKDDYSYDSSSILWPMLFGNMLCGSMLSPKSNLKESDFEEPKENGDEQ